MKNSIFLILFLLSFFHSFSQQIPVIVSDKEELISIGYQTYFLEDKTAELSLTEILQQEKLQKFVALNKNFFTMPVSKSAIWFKIVVQNRTGEDLWINVGGDVCWYIDFYKPDSLGNYGRAIETGVFRPYSSREYKSDFFWLKLADKQNTQTQTYYIKIRSGFTHEYPLEVGTLQALTQKKYISDLIAGGFIGIMLIMFLYNLFLGFATKDSIYFIYIVYIVTITLSFLFINNYPVFNHTWWWEYLLLWQVTLGTLPILFFAFRYLNLRQTMPRMFRFLIFFYFVRLFVAIATYTWHYETFFNLYQFLIIISNLILISAGIYLLVKGEKTAKFYVLGWTFMFLSVIVFILVVNNVLPYNLFTRNATFFGAALEILMFSFALADRLNLMRKDKELAQQENHKILLEQNLFLEQKVLERTKEIENQKRELFTKNDELTSAEEELRQNNEELLTLNDHLEEQKQMLEDALTKLQDSQEQLIQSEKMASLGGLVAGIAHELNTPVGIGITAASSLAEKINSFNILYKESKMKKSDLDSLVANTLEASQLILGNLLRTGDLIKSFKQVSVDQVSENKREFNFRTYMADVVKNLRPKLKHTNINIEIKCEEDLIINSYPGLFAQIITNFVINSLTHGFDEGQQGTITMRASMDEDFLKFYYSDNGKGLSEEVLQKICEPFFTTNKQKGTGLGMHIVFNLVTQKLNGELKISGQEGQGVKFFIKIPLTN